jgi:hypothetical protein
VSPPPDKSHDEKPKDDAKPAGEKKGGINFNLIIGALILILLVSNGTISACGTEMRVAGAGTASGIDSLFRAFGRNQELIILAVAALFIKRWMDKKK